MVSVGHNSTDSGYSGRDYDQVCGQEIPLTLPADEIAEGFRTKDCLSYITVQNLGCCKQRIYRNFKKSQIIPDPL